MKTLLFFVTVVLVVAAYAHVPPYVPYQGQLADPNGNPVSDSTYSINFSIWHERTGGQPVWIENQLVETYGGMFTVYLGTITPLTAQIFTVTSVDTSWLQVQVAGDAPMTPRTMIGTSPTSFFTSSVSGDIFTEPGRLEVPGGNTAELSLLVGQEQVPMINLAADSTGGTMSLADPRPTPQIPDVIVSSDVDGGSISIADPRPTPQIPDVIVSSDVDGGSISIADPRPTPVFQDFEIRTGINGIVVSLNGPEQTPLVPGLFLHSHAEGSGVSFGDPGLGNEMLSMSASESESNMRVYDSLGEDIVISLFSDVSGHGIDINTADGGMAVQFRSDGVFLYDSVGQDTLIALKIGGDVCGLRAHFGSDNQICGTSSLVAGAENTVTGDYSCVPGGRSNSATGDYCFAGGRNAHAPVQGSFVWADATGGSLDATYPNQFKCRASGGTYFYSDQNNSVGVWLPTGSSQWQALHDADSMREIRPVDTEGILEKIGQLPITRWSYNVGDPGAEHIGPSAEDFNSLFGVGVDDRHISTLDPSGVALAGMQEMLNVIEELQQQHAELERRISVLEHRIGER